jgi:hypothetical protein
MDEERIPADADGIKIAQFEDIDAVRKQTLQRLNELLLHKM